MYHIRLCVLLITYFFWWCEMN